MQDRSPDEVREEPSETTDLLESGRKAIRKEANQSILLGCGIVLLHLILLGCGLIGLRDVFRSILFVKIFGVASLLAIAGISLFTILKILRA